MARYLVTFNDVHNDEFEVYGFRIMNQKETTSFEELASSITTEFSFYANKDYLWYANGEDFLTRIELKELTTLEYETLDRVFNSEFGTFISEEYLQSIIDGEGDEPEEEEDFDNE